MLIKIENNARSVVEPSEGLKVGLSELIAGRLSDLYGQLVDVVGDDEASDLFLSIQNKRI